MSEVQVQPVLSLARDTQPEDMSKESTEKAESSQMSLSINLTAKLHDKDVEESEKVTAEEDLEDARAPPADDYISGFPLFAVLFGVSLVGFLITLDTTIVATAIPRITNQFDSLTDIGWYGSAYLLTLASFQPLSGKIYQHYSSKKSFLIGLAIFELGSLISGVANSSNLLIFGRALSGVGGSGLLTGLLTIIASSVPLAKRPAYTSAGMGLALMGILFGPLLGGVFTDHATWRLCFLINLPFGAITAITLILIHVPDAKSATATRPTWREAIVRLDLVGCALFIPPCMMVLLALGWGGTAYPWTSSVIIGLFVGSGVSLIIFLIWEHRKGKEAMIPLHMLRNHVVASATIIGLMGTASQYTAAFYLPIYFQTVKGVSATRSGLYSFPSVGSTIIGTLMAGILTTKTGYCAPFSILGYALAAIGSGLLTTLVPDSPVAHWAGYAVLAGVGRGLAMTQPITAVQVVLSKEDMPVGNSLLLLSQSLGGALWISFAQTIFANRLSPELAIWAPEVNAEAVLAVGATKFKEVIPVASIYGVIMAYNESLTLTFFLGAGASAFAFFASFFLGWTNLKAKKKDDVIEGEGTS